MTYFTNSSLHLLETASTTANTEFSPWGLLLNGELVEVAPTRMFFESPSDPRTATFVRGEMIY